MSDPEDRLSKLVQMRTSTDVPIGTRWILFAAATYILWTTLAILALTGLLQQIPSLSFSALFGSIFFDATTWLSLLGLSAATGLAYVVFRVVDRQNKHGLRVQGIFSEALKRAESMTQPGQVNVLLPLSSAEQDLSVLLQKTHDRSAILWGMLVLIPYLGWIFLIIALYHLSQASELHERTERLLIEDLERVLDTTRSPHLPATNQYLPTRNNAGFLIASLFTLGLFSIFWLYQMVSTPQNHFRYHSEFEPNLLAAFTGSQVPGAKN